MNEFIEKLIGRLEYLQKDKYVLAPTVCYVLEGVKQYVNQLAEEYNNDFCEWKQEDEEGFSNCRFDYQEIISDEVSGFVYCPYCGKKIKVVE